MSKTQILKTGTTRYNRAMHLYVCSVPVRAFLNNALRRHYELYVGLFWIYVIRILKLFRI